MGKRFFKFRSPKSVQHKIDSIKKKKQPGNGTPEAPLPKAPPVELDPEDQKYFDALEEDFRKRRPAPPPPKTEDREVEPDVPEEPEEQDRSDPFMAEREVERLVRQAQEQFDPIAQPAPPEPQEPPASAEEAPVEPVAKPAPPPEPTIAPVSIDDEPEDEPALEPTLEIPRESHLPFPPGTIIRMGDNSIGIIKEEIHNREYDLVYILCRKGQIDPRGVCLYAYELDRLGELPPEEMERIEKQMVYNRDHIIYHLDDVAYAAGIPLCDDEFDIPEGRPLGKDEVYDDGQSLQRGRRLTIQINRKIWEGVYWGSDNHGSLLAHLQDNGTWEIVRLDLDRHKSSTLPGPLMTADEMREINAGLAACSAPETQTDSRSPDEPGRADEDAPYDDGHSLQRGRQLAIVMGDKNWEAIHWGSDSLGTIVAHRHEGGQWELMHLDLERFAESLTRGPLLPIDEIRQIEKSVIRTMDQPRPIG